MGVGETHRHDPPGSPEANRRRALVAGVRDARGIRLAAAAVLVSLVTACSMSLGVLGASAASGCAEHPWCNSRLSPSRRASMVLAAMATAEKLALVSNGTAGDTRLGIPALRGIDGPNGVGEGHTHVTAFPDAETIAASWDLGVARAYGQALGAETAGKGFDWLFAPTVNIVRTPKWGREAETLGEDPFLTASLAAPEIRGIQRQHVISQVKHYAGNNQEVDRFGQPLGGDAVSDQVSARALQEIYLPGFRAAVQQGHVGSVMCSYNRINTIYSCQNAPSLATLKNFGLQGFVGPDASLAVRDDVLAANVGVDNFQLGSLAVATGADELAILTGAYNSGRLSTARLNDMTERILEAMFAVGVVDHPAQGGANSTVSTPAHRQLATRVAEQATVLLKNRQGVLPLSPRAGSIAIIGQDAGAGTEIEENGSPAVLHGPVVTPLAGIRQLVRSRSRISYAPGTLGVVALPDIPSSALTPSSGGGRGLSASYYTNQTASGSPVLTRVEPTVDFASNPAPLTPIPDTPSATAGTWTGTLTPPATGIYRFSLKVAGVAQLHLGGQLVVGANAEFARADLPGGIVSAPGGPIITFQGLARLTKNRPVPIRVQYATGSSIGGSALQVGWQPPDPALLTRAVQAARHARTAIVFANDVTSEGMDRTSLELPGDQDRLIAAVAAANPRTIVVLHTAGPVLMPWLSKVAGVLEAWYPGQQSGTAIAATLFGQADPAGRLPVTFPRTASQGAAASPAEYPGINNLAQYDEGIFVGYRYYDQHHQTPLFPFGYGLSYTSFSLDHLKLTPLAGGGFRTTVRVRNTGRLAGAEVVQAYLQFPAAAGEPPRALKAFAKVFLPPGRTRTVQLDLARSSFEVYDAAHGTWAVAPGRYRLYIGTSSRDLPLSAQLMPR
jgi:beta-glucosidase